MKRLFWTALGASVGILAVREARKTAAAMTPAALATSLVDAIRDFGMELRLAMGERERELCHDLGLDGLEADPEPTPGPSRAGSQPAMSPGEHPFESRLRDGH